MTNLEGAFYSPQNYSLNNMDIFGISRAPWGACEIFSFLALDNVSIACFAA